jgi:hypothetical protein
VTMPDAGLAACVKQRAHRAQHLRRRARAVLCVGRSAMVVPTATLIPFRPPAISRSRCLEGVVQFSFTMFDRGICYIDQPSEETRLQFYDLATGRSTTVVRNLGEVAQGLTVSPDGRTILYTRMAAPVNDLMLVENFRRWCFANGTNTDCC